MSERSREAWKAIIEKKNAERAAKREIVMQEALAEVVKPEPKIVKSVETCGQERCCGRGGPEVTWASPTVMSGDMETGGFTFGPKIPKPMLCGGDLWVPRVQTEYERRRAARKSIQSSGLDQFRERK